MKFLLVIASIGLTILCWGVYGPVLHVGQDGMGDRLRPLICVGLAYFLIAVVVPVTMLKIYGEKGSWTVSGLIWSLAAGAAGAIGALGIILAFGWKGTPIFVMPLVFGGAPVVNAFMTIYMSRTFKQVGPIFIAGLIMVVLGAVTVLISKPGSDPGKFLDSIKQIPSLMKVLAAVAVVVLSWGVYGPVLHKGQQKMGGSRLRPLICVGMAYFAIAVVVPYFMLSEPAESPNYWSGAIWSLAAGAAGAIGALGVIMAFNFGGKPVYVMPLVFGGAPVVNTFATIIAARIKGAALGDIHPLFYAGLILVASGAAIVLVFAPRGKPPEKKDKGGWGSDPAKKKPSTSAKAEA